MTRPIDYLDLEDLPAAGNAILGRAPEVRDWGLLHAALARAQTNVFGTDPYPTLPEKAAALLHSLARNRALVDGNKRLAWVATRLFAAMNGSVLRAPSVDEGEKFVVGVAAGTIELPEIVATLAAWGTWASL
ncbi:MAG TPA: Fic family protein [Actinophytocola sp.]|uniref:type II toxin-antitoxin system death-on-curing family toxin n=1 Tax=Actinophytocola sp. TaxID=1872138 RepID=UPI002E01BD59|nr:Fic family protein [Actinophytocola sp.]